LAGSPQPAVQQRQADDDGRRDQHIADGTEQPFAGAAEQPCAEPDADGIDRADQQREPDRIRGDEPGDRIADQREEIRRAEKQQDVGARGGRREGPTDSPTHNQ
jgi:hypothetical protein